ncbi:MAG: ABC transporter permease [Kiritimatiellae bacterium]|nr:ABC transporter permease [Kiritimatiellia bacterium]
MSESAPDIETTPQFVGKRAVAPRGAAPFRWERKAMGFHSLLVYIFLYAPIVILVAFSFNEAKQTARWEGFTLQWYGRLMENKLILNSMMNSLLVAGTATVVCTLIGTLAALALGRYEFKGKGPTQALLFLPIIIPEIVLGVAMVTFFGVIQMRLSVWTVIISHIVFSVSYVAIVVRARLAGFDRSLEEAAMDLGAGPVQTFFRVTLPLILPGVIAGALLVFTISIDDYVITSFVAGAGATTLPLQIYSMIKVGVTPEVNAISTLLLLFTIVMIIVAQRLQQQPTEKGERK